MFKRRFSDQGESTIKVEMRVQWFVYILECKNNYLYTGITTDVQKRFKAHASKSAKFTSYNPPIRIAYQQKVKNKGAALKREAAIKRLTRRQKIDLIAL